jgi:hypothetical protein
VNKKDRFFLGYRIWCSAVFVLVYAVWICGDLEAVTPKIWKENSQTAFEMGEVDGVSLTRDGTVTLGPRWDLSADSGEQFVWSLASDLAGTVYMGTGIKGRVYAVKPGATSPELIFDAEEETKIFALVMGPGGALYAGTSPKGLIYRIVKGKPAEVFCETGDLHVWSLLWRQGKLYAATGGEVGRILKVAKNVVEVVYQSQDPNVISMAQGQDGALYAGTDQKGLIYKVSVNGTVSVFYDAGEKEVHAIAVDKQGMVYAAAMAGRSEGKQNGKTNGETEGDGSKSVLYAIKPSGSAMRLWEVDDPLLLSVTIDSDGSLRVVTGKKGRVYRVWPNGTYTLLARLKNVHPWAVLPTADGSLWVGSSGDGKLYKLGSDYVSEGSLTSQAKDFTLVSHWGQAHWQSKQPSGTTAVMRSRSGNSETPDDTWSEWSDALKKSGDQITSRPARFLQYRLVLKSSSKQATPQIRGIQMSGLQENIAPLVLSVRLEKGDEEGDARANKPSIRKVVWNAADVNDDKLVYSIFFREAGEARWFLLKDELNRAQFIWDTDTVSDGSVQVRVVASDQGTNPIAKALSGEGISDPYEIDNTPPVVSLEAVRQSGIDMVNVTGSIQDQGSAVLSAKYAVNSGDWDVIFAEDTIFDSAKEGLDFEIGSLKRGVYTLVIRSEDVLGNVGVGKTTFEVK